LVSAQAEVGSSRIDSLRSESAASSWRFSVRLWPRKQYAAASLLPDSRLPSMTALHAATLSSGGVVVLIQDCQPWSS
jgi:hypothetical protein